jgi:hypothetical protein
MSTGNGHLRRIESVEAEQADLRSEMRLLRTEMKSLRETLRDTGRAVDTLIAELRLKDRAEGDDE